MVDDTTIQSNLSYLIKTALAKEDIDEVVRLRELEISYYKAKRQIYHIFAEVGERLIKENDIQLQSQL